MSFASGLVYNPAQSSAAGQLRADYFRIVQNPDPTQDPVGASSGPQRLAGYCLAIATLCVCYFGRLGAIGFMGNEERYASIARAMAESGDWITPRFQGQGWFEKPPLYYWSAAVSFKIFGVSAVAARLPCAVYALLATLALAWLALRLYGAETVRWMLLFLPVTVAMIAFSHDAVMDMPFTAMLTIAMVWAAELLFFTSRADSGGATNGNPPTHAWTLKVCRAILFGFFLGLATLAKGPAAVVLCGGAVLLWALFTGRWRDAFRLFHPAAIAAFCATALPWYILCAVRNPTFFDTFIVEHNFKRYFTPQFMHLEPFWYYIPALLLGSLPWAPAAIWAAVQGIARLRKDKAVSAPTLFVALWSLVVLFFFSISRTKLPGYVLPALPPATLVLARICERLAFARRKSFAATLTIAALAICVRPHWIGLLHLDFEGRAIPSLLMIVFVLAVGASNVMLAAAVLWTKKPSARGLAVAMSALPILVVLLLGPAIVRRAQTPQPSPRNPSSRFERRELYAEASPRSLDWSDVEGERFVRAARPAVHFR